MGSELEVTSWIVKGNRNCNDEFSNISCAEEGGMINNYGLMRNLWDHWIQDQDVIEKLL